MNTSQIYKNRRNLLGRRYSRTLFILPSGVEAKRSHSVKHRFKPASDFFYLSGLRLADAYLVILESKTYLLSVQHEDQLWGEQIALGPEDNEKLKSLTLASVDHLDQIIRDHLGEFDRVAIPLGCHPAVESQLLSLISYERKPKREKGRALCLCDAKMLVGTIRMIKDESEIQLLKEGGARSSRVHKKLMQQSLIGKTEREVSNWIEAHFLLENMQWTAYETIVGAGSRATQLHARATDRRIQKDDLVLIDAGGEWQGYCADITRTLPAGRVFSSAQARIYRAVLTAQKSAIAAVKPGVSLAQIHQVAVDALVEELARSGLPEKEVRKHIHNLMPHSTSHWIGLDVHDPCPAQEDNGKPLLLAPGMCFTVEPGLYFRDQNLFGEYFGFGIRLEDNVVVTEKGCELLSSVPKEIEEVEQLRSTLDS